MSLAGSLVTVRSRVDAFPGSLIDQKVGVPWGRHHWSSCIWKKLISSSACSAKVW
jgi:hypothetical protein